MRALHLLNDPLRARGRLGREAQIGLAVGACLRTVQDRRMHILRRRCRIEQRIQRITGGGAVHVEDTLVQRRRRSRRDVDERLAEGGERRCPLLPIDFDPRLDGAVELQEGGWRVETGEAGVERERECGPG